MHRGERRRGVALLEVLVALAVLGTAAASLTALALQAGRATDAARRADGDTRRASAFLAMVSLWPREDLDRRLGSRRQGDWTLDVRRPAPGVYRLSLRDSSGARELLRTSLYRPDSAEMRGGNARP